MPKTYNDLFLEARKRLKGDGVEAYTLEAMLIVSAASEKTREQFIRDARLYVADDYEKRVEEMLKRRLNGEPVAYITGSWSFYGLDMDVTSDVLIPRTDTEVLAEIAIKRAKERENPVRVLDLCAGSGCLGTAIAFYVPTSRAVMADISTAALKVCRLNILRHKIAFRASCVEADALKAPPNNLGDFDIIVCNPPYIPSKEIKKLDTSVKDFEPVSALDGGADGLDFYRNITQNWKRLLNEGGELFFECGVDQAETVRKIMDSAGFKGIATQKDTLGIDRVVYGRI